MKKPVFEPFSGIHSGPTGSLGSSRRAMKDRNLALNPWIFCLLLLSLEGWNQRVRAQEAAVAGRTSSPQVIVLGVAQDAGFPQAGCMKACCRTAWSEVDSRRHPVSLAIVDPVSKQRWLLDCSPAFPDQWRLLNQQHPISEVPGLDGILITHAHMGHYLGLAYLGREVIGAKQVPVYAMPRMATFLAENGPWDQLVRLGNIELKGMKADQSIQLNSRLSVVPILVPHRDEYSETVGFIVRGPANSCLYLPDIDKWDRWDRSIIELVQEVDIAFLDGTFYADGELPGRNMSEIPHPFIRESMAWFSKLEPDDRKKIRFIHFNHTNPVLQESGAAVEQIREAGFNVAQQGESHEL